MTSKMIKEFYQDLHAKECKKTGEKIPQTMLATQLRHILKMIDRIEVTSNRK